MRAVMAQTRKSRVDSRLPFLDKVELYRQRIDIASFVRNDVKSITYLLVFLRPPIFNPFKKA